MESSGEKYQKTISGNFDLEWQETFKPRWSSGQLVSGSKVQKKVLSWKQRLVSIWEEQKVFGRTRTYP